MQIKKHGPPILLINHHDETPHSVDEKPNEVGWNCKTYYRWVESCVLDVILKWSNCQSVTWDDASTSWE